MLSLLKINKYWTQPSVNHHLSNYLSNRDKYKY